MRLRASATGHSSDIALQLEMQRIRLPVEHNGAPWCKCHQPSPACSSFRFDCRLERMTCLGAGAGGNSIDTRLECELQQSFVLQIATRTGHREPGWRALVRVPRATAVMLASILERRSGNHRFSRPIARYPPTSASPSAVGPKVSAASFSAYLNQSEAYWLCRSSNFFRVSDVPRG